MTSKMRSLARFVYYLPSNLCNIANFLLKGVRFGKGIETSGFIYVKNRGDLLIASNVRINSSGRSNPIGAGTRTYFQILRGGKATIGEGTRISNCAVTCATSVTIGKHVRIGSGCKIYDTDFHSLNPYVRAGFLGTDTSAKTKEVVIEDFAFIGAGCFILKGARVGAASVVGAGSVVTGIIPSEEIWGGSPAKFIRKLTESEKKRT